MPKITPDPPDTDNTSPPPHTSFADIRATPRTPCSMYTINPDIHLQDLLGSVSESLASACVITMDQADRETGTSRNTLLGIAEIIMLAEIRVNRVLDIVDPVG